MNKSFPPELAGRSIDCVFEGFVPRLTFGADGMRVQADLPDLRIDEVVAADVTTLRPDVFAVNWTEANGNFVVQVQDYENGVVHNYARLADGQLFCGSGTIRPVQA
jgi:hypothetical protein